MLPGFTRVVLPGALVFHPVWHCKRVINQICRRTHIRRLRLKKPEKSQCRISFISADAFDMCNCAILESVRGLLHFQRKYTQARSSFLCVFSSIVTGESFSIVSYKNAHMKLNSMSKSSTQAACVLSINVFI